MHSTSLGDGGAELRPLDHGRQSSSWLTSIGDGSS